MLLGLVLEARVVATFSSFVLRMYRLSDHSVTLTAVLLRKNKSLPAKQGWPRWRNVMQLTPGQTQMQLCRWGMPGKLQSNWQTYMLCAMWILIMRVIFSKDIQRLKYIAIGANC